MARWLPRCLFDNFHSFFTSSKFISVQGCSTYRQFIMWEMQNSQFTPLLHAKMCLFPSFRGIFLGSACVFNATIPTKAFFGDWPIWFLTASDNNCACAHVSLGEDRKLSAAVIRGFLSCSGRSAGRVRLYLLDIVVRRQSQPPNPRLSKSSVLAPGFVFLAPWREDGE